MSSRRILVWSLWGAGFAVVGYAALSPGLGEVWSWLTLFLGGLAFGMVGLILTLRTRLFTGWLFLAAQLLMGMALMRGSSDEMLFIVVPILLTFPRGRAPDRGRRAFWALMAVSAIYLVLNFIGVLDENLTWLFGFLLVAPAMLVGAIRVFILYRQSLGETRAQLKWLAWVLMIGGSLLLLSATGAPLTAKLNNVAGLVLFVGSPMAIWVAVTRYRLYEIDRIISRTVSYTLLVVVLGSVYAGLVALVGTRFDDSLAVAGSTLAVAALFNPIRRRVQGWVDRRFNRSKYDAEKVINRFSGSLNNRVDPGDLVDDWLEVVAETVGPANAGVWIREAR